jgi:hypothetical protein
MLVGIALIHSLLEYGFKDFIDALNFGIPL